MRDCQKGTTGSGGECSDDVLMYVENDEDYTISTGFYGYYTEERSWQGWWSTWAYGSEKLNDKYKVLAWMPLPKSYGGKQSE